MKIFAILFVALAGFAIWQYNTISSLNERISVMTLQLNAYLPTPAKATPTPAPASATPIPQILCPACHGERNIVFDPIGSGNALNRKTQQCPVCLGLGYRLLTVPAGRMLCPDCKGMGLVYSPNDGHHSISTGNCARCGATGLLAVVK